MGSLRATATREILTSARMTPDSEPHARTAVILVTYNGWPMTRDCLVRLLGQCSVDDRVIVVDNASTDGTLDQIHREFPQVERITLERNVGFGTANNVGVEHAGPVDFLILLNNDTLPEPGLLTGMRRSLCEAETVLGSPLVMTPGVLHVDGSPQRNYYTDISLWTFFTNAWRTESMAAKRLHGSLRAIPRLSTIASCDWSSAICWCMRRNTWDMVGGFDPRIFMYYEDVDFAWRARARGVRFCLETAVNLVHLGGGSAQCSLSRSLQHDMAQAYVFGKRWGLVGRLVSWMFRLVRSTLRLAIFAPLSLFWPRYQGSRQIHQGLLRNLF